MTAILAEIIVPIRAVQSVSLVKILDVRDVAKVEAVRAFFAVHGAGDVFGMDEKRAANRGRGVAGIAHAPTTCRDERGEDGTHAFVRDEHLFAHGNVDPLPAALGITMLVLTNVGDFHGLGGEPITIDGFP